jgi:hypothetical protein
MVVTYKKLIKADGDPTELERSLAQHLSELSNSEELKNQINDLYFVGAQVCLEKLCIFKVCLEVGTRQQELHYRLGSVSATS